MTNGRKNRKVWRLWLVLAVALLGTIAVVLMWAHNDQYDFYREKDFVSNGRTYQYSEGAALEEMNFRRYLAYMPGDDLVAHPDMVISLSLPCDVHYYAHEGDAEPAFTLDRGTEVFAVLSAKGVDEGYGTVSWPTYEKGWRYAWPFATDGGSKPSFDDPMYFVLLSELEQVSQAFLKANRKSAGSGRIAQMVWAQTRMIDMALYKNGVFCSKDLERMFLW